MKDMYDRDRCGRCLHMIEKPFHATSRADNKTHLCSRCGNIEAMISQRLLSRGETASTIKQHLIDALAAARLVERMGAAINTRGVTPKLDEAP